MASNTIRMQAHLSGTTATIKSLITHPMENGLRKDPKTGELVPAHFIEEVVCTLNGAKVMNVFWSGSVSKNPYLAFELQGAKLGDVVGIKWTDNKADSDYAEAKIA